ncbi:hypothetical protein SJAG_01479 [Schizosaccharomyces japonicus yFS275]|uniref:Uncharacterized protein n=1 Tax=Schizosaccharomyces japonicus (strain yFS275 / FY16936) TaxID=402676 RepID=B6JY21_SCHJY|nr:hypothetical protein SJAG_01479 [Schizosaccharomyces japonicus yFS275]EEB06439.1 hypothetical protein SJAG_01479 [Schizosaccharomyces japonicus yFS275]
MSSVTTETDDFSDIASQTDAKLVALLATGQLLCWNVSLASPHTTTHLFTTSLAWPLSGFAAVSSHSLLLVSHSTFTIVALDSMIQEDASSPRSHPIDVTLLTSLHSVGEPIQAFSVCSNIVCLFTQSRVLFTSLNGLAVTTLNSIQTFSPAGVRSLCHLPAAVPFFAFVKDSTFGLMKFAPPYMLLRGKFPGDVRHAFAARTADGTPVLLGYTVDMMYVVMIDENVLSANPRIRVASIPIPQGLLSLSVLHMDKTAIRVVAQSYSSFSVREFPLSFAYTFPLESEPLVITPAAWSSVGTLPSEPAALLNTFQQEAESVASHTHDAVALYVNTCISEQLKCAVMSAMNSLQTKSSVVSEQVQLQHSIQTQAVDETNIPVSSENSIESPSPSPTGSSVAVIEPDLTTESLPRPSSATETNDLALLDLDPVDAIVEFTLHPSPSAFSDLRDQIEPYLSKLSAPHLLSLMHVLSKLGLDVDEDDDLSVLRVSCIVHAFFQFRALQVESKTLTDSLVQPVLQNIQANITQLGALGSARHQVKVKFAREVLEAALKTFE